MTPFTADTVETTARIPLDWSPAPTAAPATAVRTAHHRLPAPRHRGRWWAPFAKAAALPTALLAIALPELGLRWFVYAAAPLIIRVGDALAGLTEWARP